jgi:hypothetical protein
MTSWSHLAAGAVALALAQPLLKAASSSSSGLSRLAKLATVPAVVVSKFMDPTVPAFAAPLPTAAAPTPNLGPAGTGKAPLGGAGNTGAPNPYPKYSPKNFPE